jgi:hypothetical protein
MARESVPEFLNNMLALMVSLSKLFTKFQIFFAATPKRNTTVDFPNTSQSQGYCSRFPLMLWASPASVDLARCPCSMVGC